MSVAVTVKETAVPAILVASTVMGIGKVSCGGVVSMTETVKPPLALLPLASVVVQATKVEPTGKVVPEAGEQVMVG